MERIVIEIHSELNISEYNEMKQKCNYARLCPKISDIHSIGAIMRDVDEKNTKKKPKTKLIKKPIIINESSLTSIF